MIKALLLPKALAALLLLAMPAQAAELVMFDSNACAWCQKWHRDIGGSYGGTRAGTLLPLRRVDLGKPIPADLRAIPAPRATPTFVIVACGREWGRMVGYTSDKAFWSELTTLVNRWQTAGQGCGG